MKLCGKGLHDLDDPAMAYVNPSSGQRQCGPCRREGMRLANRRRRQTDPEGERKRARDNTNRWRAANPERVRARQRAWYAANREAALERKRQWRLANPESSRASVRKWWMQNREYDAERRKERYLVNREREAQAYRQWVLKNRSKRRESSQRRRAQARVADVAEVRAWIAVIAEDPCQYCGAVGTTDDHIVPLSRGGDHCWSNLGRACARCNSRKRARPLLSFLVAGGMS